MAFSIKGDSVTLIKDCSQIITKKLPREPTSQLNIAGIITVGYDLLDEENSYRVRVICIKNKANLNQNPFFREIYNW